MEKEDKPHVTIEDQLKEAEEKEKIKLAGGEGRKGRRRGMGVISDEKVIVTPLVKYFFDQAKNKGHPDTVC